MKSSSSKGPRRRSSLVARPRLTALLDGALDYPVTLVCAPLGYGKTVAVDDWLSRRKIEAVKLDCDCADDGNGLASLCDSAEPSGVFVLENAQCLQSAPQLRKRVKRFLAHVPTSAHVIVVSRYVPEIGLSRLRLEGDLLEIGVGPLAFTELEARDLLLRAGFEAAEIDCGVIVEKTGGWSAALRLLCAAGFDGVEDAISWDRMEAMLFSYLDEELLSEMPDDEASFFVGASHLGEFCVSQVAFCLEIDEANAIAGIDRLVKDGLVQPEGFLPNGEMRYQCHQLLSDVVSRHSRLRCARGRAETLARASVWAEENAMFGAAFDCAEATRDWDRMGALVMRHWRDLYERDNLALLRAWIGRIPNRYVESHPGLCIVEALPLALAGERECAYSRLRIAKNGLREDGDYLQALYYTVHGLALSVLGEVGESCESSKRALELLDPQESLLRAMAQQVLGGALALENPSASIMAFEQASVESSKAGLPMSLCSALSNLASLCSLVGRYEEAVAWADRAKAVFPLVEHESRPMLVLAYLAAAEASYVKDDTCRAAEELRFVLSHMEDLRAQDCEARALLLAARLARLDGDVEAELAHVRRAFARLPECSLRSFVSEGHIASWMECGALSRTRVEKYAVRVGSPLSRASAITIACACGKADDGLVRDAEALIESSSALPIVRVSAGICAAIFAERLGRADEADALLWGAFVAAEPESMARPFIDDAEALSAIWGRIAKRHRDSRVARLYALTVSRAAPKTSGSVAATLTDRELDVVRLIAQGLSVQQAADKLFVSRETVKKHLSNVYSKLGVHGKMQAVAALDRYGML